MVQLYIYILRLFLTGSRIFRYTFDIYFPSSITWHYSFFYLSSAINNCMSLNLFYNINEYFALVKSTIQFEIFLENFRDFFAIHLMIILSLFPHLVLIFNSRHKFCMFWNDHVGKWFCNKRFEMINTKKITSCIFFSFNTRIRCLQIFPPH